MKYVIPRYLIRHRYICPDSPSDLGWHAYSSALGTVTCDSTALFPLYTWAPTDNFHKPGSQSRCAALSLTGDHGLQSDCAAFMKNKHRRHAPLLTGDCLPGDSMACVCLCVCVRDTAIILTLLSDWCVRFPCWFMQMISAEGVFKAHGWNQQSYSNVISLFSPSVCWLYSCKCLVCW